MLERGTLRGPTAGVPAARGQPPPPRARLIRVISACAILLSMAGCQAVPPLPDLPGEQTGPETQAVPTALSAAGFEVTPVRYRPVPAAYLHAPVTAMSIGEESLAIWEYPSPDAAADDAQRISPRGVDSGFMELGSEARWFRRNRLIVLYLGTDPKLRALLRERLGQTFVGPPA